MRPEDDIAMQELALEMPWQDAIKWLRSEGGSDLRFAARWADKLAREHPDTELGRSAAALGRINI